MEQFVIVVGDVATGVDHVYEPFTSEAAAREWAIGYSDRDRFENWFSIALAEPTDEEE